MQPIGVGKRAVAIVIDAILLGIVMEGTRGATLGKMAMKLKVVKEGGGNIDWQAAIVRNVVRLVDGLFLYLVAAVAVWVSKKRQRLGDMAAGTIVVSSRAAAVMLAALIFLGAVTDEAWAASPRYEELVLSDSDGGPEKTVFKPDTPKIYLRTKVVDMSSGTMLKGDWIAEKTKVAPPNYRIDGTELKIGALTNVAKFNMSKPTAGWPEGDYRVDLFINGKPATQVKFKVAK